MHDISMLLNCNSRYYRTKIGNTAVVDDRRPENAAFLVINKGGGADDDETDDTHIIYSTCSIE